MAAVMIGVDPHKSSHTAVAITASEQTLGELQVRACAAQAERLLAWAVAAARLDLAAEFLGACAASMTGCVMPDAGWRQRSRPRAQP